MRAWIIFSLLFMSQALWAQQQSNRKPLPAPQPPITPDRVYNPEPPAAAGKTSATASTASPAAAVPAATAAQPNPETAPLASPIPPTQTPASPVPPLPEAPVSTFKGVAVRGVTIAPSITYYSRRITESSSQVGEVATFIIDSKAGYTFHSGLFVGAQGLYETGKASNESVKGFYFGPTLGYSDENTGIFISGTYHVVGQMDLGVGKFDKVRGIQIDLGYPMAITNTVRFGPTLSWKNLKYTDGGALADTDMKGISPYATLWINF